MKRWTCIPAILTLLMAAFITGCGEGDDEEDAVSGPIELRITSVQHPGGSRWQVGDPEARVRLGCDRAQPLLIEVGPNPEADSESRPGCATNQAACGEPGLLRNWTLRPPGGCGTAVQCGYVVLLDEDDEALHRAAATSLLAAAPEPNTERTFRVALRRDDGQPFTDTTGAVVSDSVTLAIEPASDCEPTP